MLSLTECELIKNKSTTDGLHIQSTTVVISSRPHHVVGAETICNEKCRENGSILNGCAILVVQFRKQSIME